MESSIFRYILRYTLKDQILILALTLFSLPFLYASLEVPKLIINDAIGGANRPKEIFGYPVDQLDYLFLLCGLFLLLVIINGGLKYVLNVYRGVVGERMLRRLRYDLFTRLLRFPIPHFKKVSQGEVIPIITAETEPLGGFIGEAYALPAYQGGILLTYLIFIFNQDVLLGIVATALYPFQLYIIPKLQRSVNQLGKKRVLAARRLGDRIGDSISGIEEVHSHDTSRFERAVISERLGRIYSLRFDIYKRKFFIKFLNNFLAQVTPFFFYLFGGYYIIQGELSLGALVAVLAAYKDLSSPWKELLKFYQIKEDVRIKYEQIIEMFQPDGMLETGLQDATP
ncbi:MAG: ABC transporter ATP-binding protein, partial [Motiliproteus sp.]|nr:ABC transporter ATP-binding protein [Motiliproteus sp.]